MVLILPGDDLVPVQQAAFIAGLAVVQNQVVQREFRQLPIRHDDQRKGRHHDQEQARQRHVGAQEKEGHAQGQKQRNQAGGLDADGLLHRRHIRNIADLDGLRSHGFIITPSPQGYGILLWL